MKQFCFLELIEWLSTSDRRGRSGLELGSMNVNTLSCSGFYLQQCKEMLFGCVQHSHTATNCCIP